MELYKHNANSEQVKRFMIQGKTEKSKWIEIRMDYIKNIFQCQKKSFKELPKEWIKTSGYTFPSSLLYEFIRDSKYEQE